MNATFVNGVQVQDEMPLFFGSTIVVGSTVLTLSAALETALPELIGVELVDRYVIERLIRHSLKGAVFEAQDRNLACKVAIKILSPDFVSYPGYRERFQREAEMTARLRHPHICPVVQFGDTRIRLADGNSIHTVFLCLPLMEGGSLVSRVEATEAIELGTTIRWVTQLASALSYAHRHEIVHGDLKPSTIVFDGADNPYVTDFSLTQHVSSSGEHVAMGSPPYMAPEQWDSQPLTPATDQFALGVVAYYMITGVRPFEGQDNPEIRRRNFARGPMPAHEEASASRRPGPPAPVSDVLRRAMAPSPADRFASIEQFALELSKASSGPFRPPGQTRVFLSYHRDASAGWAVLFSRELKDKYDIKAFVDTDRLDGAGRFPERLARAIEQCDVFVCFLSSTTLGSTWVREEIRLAHQYGRPMVPVFQEGYARATPDHQCDPSIEALLSYDGIHLLDQLNIHVDYTVGELARLVKDTVTRASGHHRQ